MARTARIQAEQSTYSESDSGGDIDSDAEATPRPAARHKGKRRVSEGWNPDSPGRAPLQAVNMNDDEAEKRRRRKSAKIVQPMIQADNTGEPSSSQPDAGPSGTPRAVRHAKQAQPLAAVAEAPPIKVSLDVMSTNYEEWMKLATDNKINAANSWNLALIDYFHDMSLLRNNRDNSINFQKASCTLDGCVKIWTSRVDSVGTDTGKLLSNLASDGRQDGDDDQNLSDNPDGGDAVQRQKRIKSRSAEATLVKSITQLQVKKLDLEYSVDPLFKKTCADFDEGGASGLLMNHLSLGVGSEGCMRIIFDASDSVGKRTDEEEEEDLNEPEDLIDLSGLRNFIPDLDALEDKVLAESLSDFAWSKPAFSIEPSTFLNGTYQDSSPSDDENEGFGGTDGDVDMPMDDGGDGGAPPVEDFFVGDQAVDDDYGGGMDFPTDDGGGFDGGPADEQPPQAIDDTGRSIAFEPFDPRRAPNERDLVMAMTDPGAEGGSLDYFDQTFVKNWAGPEHWKLRKVVRRPDTTADASSSKPRREKKEPFKIDFLTPSDKPLKQIQKELFAPVTRGGAITLPQFRVKKGRGARSKGPDKRPEQLLPDDMHFSSLQLTTLFLKPKFALKMRGQPMVNNANGEVDENFWAQAAGEAANRRDGAENEGEDGAPIPFNTQFFHDDYDDIPGGFDDAYDGPGDGGEEASGYPDGSEDFMQSTQGRTNRVKPETVNYTRRAKRVDVRKLKETIWQGLDIVTEPAPENDDDDDVDMEHPDAVEPTPPTEAREFTNVISGLHKSYPQDKMADISTSFCFICLLHLANERGLKLEVADDKHEEEDVKQDEGEGVGNIWDLKVYRDPDATPSA